MLTVPSTMASVPRVSCTGPETVPVIRIAPTSTTPWIAFAPDISGVCSTVETFETTSKPTNTASTKMVSSAMPLLSWVPEAAAS